MDLSDTFKEIGVGTSVGGLSEIGAAAPIVNMWKPPSLKSEMAKAWKPITLGESATKAWSTLGTAVVRKSWGLDSGLLTGLQRHDAIHKNMFGALESQKFLKNSLAATAPWMQLNKDLTGFQSLASTLNENLGSFNPLKSLVNTGFKVPSLSTDSPLVGLQRNATKSALWDLVERNKKQELRWLGGDLLRRSSLSALDRKVAPAHDSVSKDETDALSLGDSDEMLSEILKCADSLREQIGQSETDEFAQDFLDHNPELVMQINNSPFLVKLSLNGKRLAAGAISIIVFFTFVSLAVYGTVTYPSLWQLLGALGIGTASGSAQIAYKQTKRILDKYVSD